MGNNCYCNDIGAPISLTNNSSALTIKEAKIESTSSKTHYHRENIYEIQYQDNSTYKGEIKIDEKTEDLKRHGKGTQIWIDGSK